MNFFNYDLKKILMIAALITFPLLSVNLQQRSKDRPWILAPFYFVAGSTQNAYAGFSSGVRSTTDLYLNLIGVKTENKRLKVELAELKAQLSTLTELKLENERLTKLLTFKDKMPMVQKAAHIVGRDINVDYDTITIDLGAEHGITKNMGVLTIGGVVGYVVEVETSVSKVLLITDRYAVIDGVVQRSRARGIVQGQSKTCLFTGLTRNDDVQIGDTIVTSGIDNFFPKGFPIGTVSAVKKNQYGLGQEVTLDPVVKVSNLEEVFVIVNANHFDIETPKGT